MKYAKVVSFIGVLAMTIVLLYGFIVGSFFEDGGEIMRNPWGIVSLVDLYVGFILFSMWILYRETNLINGMIWVILMMVLGFFTGALYVFLALVKSKGSMDTFFHGEKVLNER